LEIGEIYNDMFERKYDALIKGEGKMSDKMIDRLNGLNLKSIEYFNKLILSIMESTNKELLDNIETVRTVITSKFNIAKNYSRFQTNVQKEKIESLIKSMEAYRWIGKFIEEYVEAKGNMTPELIETKKTCEEMVALLPSKIDKVSHGLL
jgi:hypothetical protein